MSTTIGDSSAHNSDSRAHKYDLLTNKVPFQIPEDALRTRKHASEIHKPVFHLDKLRFRAKKPALWVDKPEFLLEQRAALTSSSFSLPTQTSSAANRQLMPATNRASHGPPSAPPCVN